MSNYRKLAPAQTSCIALEPFARQFVAQQEPPDPEFYCCRWHPAPRPRDTCLLQKRHLAARDARCRDEVWQAIVHFMSTRQQNSVDTASSVTDSWATIAQSAISAYSRRKFLIRPIWGERCIIRLAINSGSSARGIFAGTSTISCDGTLTTNSLGLAERLCS